MADLVWFRPRKTKVNPVDHGIGLEKNRAGSHPDNSGIVPGINKDIRRPVSKTGLDPTKKIKFRHDRIVSNREPVLSEGLQVSESLLSNSGGIILERI